jgi:predicted DNA-binding transcriptional regulator AlpA
MEIITTQQLADFLEVDIATIRRWIKTNLLPEPIRLGHKVFWPRYDIKTFLTKREQ